MSRTPPTPAADANPFVGTNWQVRADTPATDTPGTYGTMTPTIEVVPPHYPLATEEREAVAQWCSGCHEVRSVDCYRADCPKSDTERRAAEILAAEANERARIASNETAWLLERDYFGQLRYFSAACQDEAPTDWTPDNLQALRFARRIDAERFASREATDCIDIRVVEHMWCAIEHGAGK